MASYAETALVRALGFLSESQASIAHNLANVDSTGFKRCTALATGTTSRFQSVLDGELPTVGFAPAVDWTPGTVRVTGEASHVGIEGENNKNVFFRVRGKSGELFYTRNGQLQLDDQGRVVAADGSRYVDGTGADVTLGGDVTSLASI